MVLWQRRGDGRAGGRRSLGGKEKKKGRCDGAGGVVGLGREAGVDGTTPRAVGWWLDLSAAATICSYDGIAAALCYS